MLLRERGRSRISGKRICGRWCIRLRQTSPLTKQQTNTEGHTSSIETGFSGWCYLCIGVCHAWDRCTSPTPDKPTSTGGEIEMMPQENIGSVVTHCPASKTSLGWINGKLWLLPWTSMGASTEDGWRPQVMWHGCGCWGEHVHLAEGMTLLPIDTIG